jgi:hypothetical protein
MDMRIEKSDAGLINKLEYPHNYNLTLVLAKRKNATTLSFYCFGNEISDECKRKIDQAVRILSSLNLPFYFAYTKRESEYVGKCNFLHVYVGKNEKCLGRIVNAKTDRDFGKNYGFPRTAVRAFEKGKGISLTEFTLPEKFRNYNHFAQFVFSKEHWSREMRKVKRLAKIVKKFNPELYDYMTS